MAVFKKTSAREMKWCMVVFSVFFFVMMGVFSKMGAQGTGMIFMFFGIAAAGLAVFWAVRQKSEE